NLGKMSCRSGPAGQTDVAVYVVLAARLSPEPGRPALPTGPVGMGILVRTMLVVGLVLAVPAAVWVYGSLEQSAPAKAPTAPAPELSSTGKVSRLVGSAGCAAAACHGGSPALSLTAPPGPTCWQTSATHWLAVDPHTKAYAALETQLAKDIVRLMAGKD